MGTVSIDRERVLFTFCEGGSWKLKGGKALPELKQIHSGFAENGRDQFVATLLLKGAERVNLRKNPSSTYWAVASVEQVVGVHEGSSC